METVTNWLSHNKEWFFSGVGVLILGFVLKMIFSFTTRSKNPSASQTQRSGKKSINMQSGRDINVNSRSKDDT